MDQIAAPNSPGARDRASLIRPMTDPQRHGADGPVAITRGGLALDETLAQVRQQGLVWSASAPGTIRLA